MNKKALLLLALSVVTASFSFADDQTNLNSFLFPDGNPQGLSFDQGNQVLYGKGWQRKDLKDLTSYSSPSDTSGEPRQVLALVKKGGQLQGIGYNDRQGSWYSPSTAMHFVSFDANKNIRFVASCAGAIEAVNADAGASVDCMILDQKICSTFYSMVGVRGADELARARKICDKEDEVFANDDFRKSVQNETEANRSQLWDLVDATFSTTYPPKVKAAQANDYVHPKVMPPKKDEQIMNRDTIVKLCGGLDHLKSSGTASKAVNAGGQQ